MESFSGRERRERAVRAAVEIGAAGGIKSGAPVVLKDSNNTIVHLAPSPVVAKVATPALRKRHASNLEHELSVALHLARMGAPAVRPSDELPHAVYRHDGLAISFWEFCPGEVREEIDRAEVVAVVQEFHAAFAGYAGELKSFTEKYEECYSLLDSGGLSPELSADDRRFLRQVYRRLRAKLETFRYECVPTHEEIHGGNVLWVGAKPLLIDFESCCLAPREIDFLPFSGTRLSSLPHLDGRLMEVLGPLKSFCVAVWCWAEPDRAPEVREAAGYHLSRLRSLNP